MSGNGSDKRDAPRVAVEAFVKALSAEGDKDEFVFRTRDISSSGFFLYTKVAHIYPIKVGDELDIELYNYDSFVPCRVTIVRVVDPDSHEAKEYPAGFGVRITNIADDAKGKLQEILRQIADKAT